MYEMIIFILISGCDFFDNNKVSFWPDESAGSSAVQTNANVNEDNNRPLKDNSRQTNQSQDFSAIPQPVKAFLDNPSKENAYHYLKWQQEKINKVGKAMEALSKLKAELKDKAQKANESAKKGSDKFSPKTT